MVPSLSFHSPFPYFFAPWVAVQLGGVPRGGAGVGLTVVAVGEISAGIEKDAETPVAKLVAIAFQVVAAKLVNHDDDNEFRAGIVGRRECQRERATKHENRAEQQDHAQGSGESHRELVYRRTFVIET